MGKNILGREERQCKGTEAGMCQRIIEKADMAGPEGGR